jgi:3-oxoadipate enol-lactonase
MLMEKTFHAGEMTLNYAESPGAGRAIVMLHGLTGDWLGFRGLMLQLAGDWHTYACDLRGHGKSGRQKGRYRLLDYARDVVSFQENVSGRAVLLGHSLGALTAMVCGAERPEMVEALVLLDPPVYVRNAPVATHAGASGLFRWVHETMKNGPTFDQVVEACRVREPDADENRIQATALRVSRVDPATVGAALQDTMGDGVDMDAALRNLRCPMLVLRGEWKCGACVRDEDAQWFRALMPSARIIQIKGGTHGFLWEQAEETTRLIKEFLEELE